MTTPRDTILMLCDGIGKLCRSVSRVRETNLPAFLEDLQRQRAGMEALAKKVAGGKQVRRCQEDDEIYKLLLQMPTRKNSLLPELIEHFPATELMSFLRAFSGTILADPRRGGQLPDPHYLVELDRDAAIAKALRGTPDHSELIRICSEHAVTYRHVCEIHLVVFKRELHAPPTNGTVEGRIAGAAVMLKEHSQPQSPAIIQEMFELKTEHMKSARLIRDNGHH